MRGDCGEIIQAILFEQVSTLAAHSNRGGVNRILEELKRISKIWPSDG